MNKYNYFCTRCSFKKIISSSKDLDDFIVLKSSPIQSIIPAIDYSNGSVRTSKSVAQPKILKCPKCGFSNRAKLIKEEAKSDQASDIDGR